MMPRFRPAVPGGTGAPRRRSPRASLKQPGELHVLGGVKRPPRSPPLAPPLRGVVRLAHGSQEAGSAGRRPVGEMAAVFINQELSREWVTGAIYPKPQRVCNREDEMRTAVLAPGIPGSPRIRGP